MPNFFASLGNAIDYCHRFNPSKFTFHLFSNETNRPQWRWMWHCVLVQRLSITSDQTDVFQSSSEKERKMRWKEWVIRYSIGMQDRFLIPRVTSPLEFTDVSIKTEQMRYARRSSQATGVSLRRNCFAGYFYVYVVIILMNGASVGLHEYTPRQPPNAST